MDDIANAKVTINVQRGESGGTPTSMSKSDKGSKDILKTLKNIGGTLTESKKLQMSGLLGMGSGAAAGVGAAVGVAALAHMSTQGTEELEEQLKDMGIINDFVEEFVDGERIVKEVNRKTEEVVDVMTKQEAIDRGIFDTKGKIKSKLATGVPLVDSMVKYFGGISNSVLKVFNSVKDVLDLYDKEKVIQQKIIDEEMKRLERLRAHNKTTGDITLGFSSPTQGYTEAVEGLIARNVSTTYQENPWETIYRESNMDPIDIIPGDN